VGREQRISGMVLEVSIGHSHNFRTEKTTSGGGGAGKGPEEVRSSLDEGDGLATRRKEGKAQRSVTYHPAPPYYQVQLPHAIPDQTIDMPL